MATLFEAYVTNAGKYSEAFLLFVRLCTCPCFSMMLFPRSIKAAST